MNLQNPNNRFFVTCERFVCQCHSSPHIVLKQQIYFTLLGIDVFHVRERDEGLDEEA